MDIRNWSLGQIVQLPEHVFGRKYCVSVELTVGGGITEYAMSEMAFPERMILWQVAIYWGLWSAAGSYLRLGMRDQIPTSPAEMSSAEEILPGVGESMLGPNMLHAYQYTGQEIIDLKAPMIPPARHLVAQVTSSGGATSNVRAICVVSGIPNEVPECVLSV